MQQTNSKPIQEYDTLLKKLKPNGFYQIRLIVLLAFYWSLSGLNEAAFQLAIARQISTLTFLLQEGLQIVTIVGGILLAFRLPRTVVNQGVVGVMFVGSTIMAVGANLQNTTTTLVGEFMVVMLHNTLAINILMIVLEHFTLKKYPIVWTVAMTAFTLGKLIALWLFKGDLDQKQWAVIIVLPCCAIYIISLLFIKQSPRYWIDYNIQKAQKLLHQIADTNKIPFEPIQNVLQRQYFWHRVALTKYSPYSLIKYKSISYNTYILCICGLMLGIICRCPDFIQHLRQNTAFEVEDTLEIAWISLFQLLGLIPSYLCSRIIRRKSVVIAGSTVMLILCLLLAFLELTNFYLGNALVYSMAIFGLSSFFSVALYFFLILSALQFYPHTLRTLGCGMIFCSYRFGKLLFSMHIELIENRFGRNEGMMEFVICCSVLLLFHSCLLAETFKEEGKYDLEQIQELQADDFT